MLTIATKVDAMNRLGRAMADATRSRILLSLLSAPGYPAGLARELGLTRTNVSNHLACLRGCGIVVAEPEGRRTRYEIADPHLAAALMALVEVTLAVDEDAPCLDPTCAVAGCCAERAQAERDPAQRDLGERDLAGSEQAKRHPRGSDPAGWGQPELAQPGSTPAVPARPAGGRR